MLSKSKIFILTVVVVLFPITSFASSFSVSGPSLSELTVVASGDLETATFWTYQVGNPGWTNYDTASIFFPSPIEIDFIGYWGGTPGDTTQTYFVLLTSEDLTNCSDTSTIEECESSPNYILTTLWTPTLSFNGIGLISSGDASGFLADTASAAASTGSNLWIIIAVVLGIIMAFFVLEKAIAFFTHKLD